MNKFIAWGCKYHTHSFIHHSYKKAFEYLGWETYWLSDDDDVSSFDFSDSLFLTLGGHDDRIPKRKDCKYILHNCETDKYDGLDFLILQVYTHGLLERQIEKISDCIFYQKDENILYQPWATDLLPYEIIELDKLNFVKDKKVYWVGSIWDYNNQGNISEMSILRSSLNNRGIELINPKEVPFDKNKDYIDMSYISPSIQGRWQVEQGYIPCRIFKNISYGSFGITNSKTVYDLFNQSIVFDDNIDILIEKSLDRINSITISEINEQINFVKNNHTYLNRIENILKLI
jgi:hypothetical protein